MTGTVDRRLPGFLEWLSSPRDDRGVYLADEADGWQRFTYATIAKASRRIAAEYSAAGVRPGDVVCLTAPTTYDSLIALLSVWLAGATMCPLPEPTFESDDEYIDHIGGVLGIAEPALIVTSAEVAPLINKAMGKAGRPGSAMVFPAGVGQEAEPQGGAALPEDRADIAVLQFTSGSTGNPQGVRVTWDNLNANLAVATRWFQWREGHGVGSWLPLYHDMGLLGIFLPGVALQIDQWLMRPDQFIRNPGKWLSCFGPGKARFAAAPSFAFAYLARRVGDELLESLDLSGWRGVIVGAEAIDPLALAAFAHRAAATGFSADTFLPGYGLAENTLCVTSPGLGRGILLVRPNWAELGIGGPVRIVEQAQFGADWAATGTGWLVGHGSPDPVDGIVVRLLDEDGQPVPDGHLGEITITGPLVAHGYHGQHPDRATRFTQGVLHTADAGFFHEGQLFVVGRMGDSFKLLGRAVYMEDLDAKVAEAARLNRGRIVAASDMWEGQVGVVVFAEAEPGTWIQKVVEVLRAELGPQPRITVISGTQGMIRRTSSGKPRRRRMRELFKTGRLEGVLATDSSG